MQRLKRERQAQCVQGTAERPVSPEPRVEAMAGEVREGPGRGQIHTVGHCGQLGFILNIQRSHWVILSEKVT